MERALAAEGLTIAIVVSGGHADIGRRLLRGALDVLKEQGAGEPDVHWVPQLLNLPVAALALAERGVDAVLCLGCLMAGDGALDFTAAETASGLMQVQLETGIPCVLGLLAAGDREEALAASGPKNNRGRDAAEEALEMVRVLGQIQEGQEPPGS